MTRAVTTQFAAATSPSLPALDADLLGVANLAVVACTATGTNAVVLTPLAATLTVSAYSDKELYSFNAPATSTGVMTVQVSSGAALKLFRSGGVTQATTNDVVSAQFYLVAYQASLDTGTGGFVIVGATNRLPTQQSFTTGTAATYTTPAGCVRIFVRCWGAGASGGGGDNGTHRGTGGGGGGYCEKSITAPAATYTYTVGVGGTAVGISTAGNAGTNTTFSTLTATGGGAGATATGSGQGGSAGGIPTGGDRNVQGGGSTANGDGTANYVSTGGDSPMGGFGGKINVATAGQAPGGGGSAGNATGNSGAGAAGQIIVDEFYN